MTAGPRSTSSLEETPAVARSLFGERVELAREYARLLSTVGVERGLVGPREPERVWTRHILNSASVAAWVPPTVDVLDLGSGAGLPGIPLALARPDLRVCLVEPMARRIDFLHEVVSALGLDIAVRRARAQQMQPRAADVVVARAVAPLARLVPLALPLLRPGGRLVALKGQGVQADIEAAAEALSRWPAAHLSVVSESISGLTATAVIIGLDETPPESGGSTR